MFKIAGGIIIAATVLYSSQIAWHYTKEQYARAVCTKHIQDVANSQLYKDYMTKDYAIPFLLSPTFRELAIENCVTERH